MIIISWSWWFSERMKTALRWHVRRPNELRISHQFQFVVLSGEADLYHILGARKQENEEIWWQCTQTLFQEYLKTDGIFGLVSQPFIWSIISWSILLVMYSLAWIRLRQLIHFAGDDISKNLRQSETIWRPRKWYPVSTAICQYHVVHTFARDISVARVDQNFFSLVAAFRTNTVKQISCLPLNITQLTT
jgi:hypothetical protein